MKINYIKDEGAIEALESIRFHEVLVRRGYVVAIQKIRDSPWCISDLLPPHTINGLGGESRFLFGRVTVGVGVTSKEAGRLG